MRRLSLKRCVFFMALILFARCRMETVSAAPIVEGEEKQAVFPFETNRILSGAYGNEAVYFDIPEYWAEKEATVDLKISLSPLLVDVPAYLNFYVNNEPVFTEQLDYSKGEYQEIHFNIPAETLKENQNYLSVSGFAAIYDKEGCIDQLSNANWVKIHGESQICVAYQMRTPQYVVSEYPYPMISGENSNGENIAIVVPDSPKEGELTAASWMSADLGKRTGEENGVSLETASDFDRTQESGVVIGLYDRLPKFAEEILTFGNVQKERLRDNAVICVMKGESGNYTMVISSMNEECLTEAVWYLMDESRLSQEKGETVYVGKGSSEQLRTGMKSKENDTYTVGELNGTEKGLNYQGPFHQEQTLFLDEHTRRILGKNGYMDLKFRYSENMDFNRASITVLLNQTPVASRRLMKENAFQDELKFSIPEDMIGEKITSVTVAFDLDIPETYCTYRNDDIPWAYLTEDSVICLPQGERQKLDFDSIPYPFGRSGNFDQTAAVLPEHFTDHELQLLGQLMGMYGSELNPYGDFRVVYAENMDETYKEKNLMVIGTPKDQPVFSEISGQMPFAFDEKEGVLQGNKSLALSENYMHQVAVLEFVSSGEDKEYRILVAGAENDSLLGNMSEFLRKEENRSKLSGDTVLIDIDRELRSYIFQDGTEDVERPTLRERIEQNKESVVYALVSTGGMLLILLAAILLFIRARALKK